jgi:uncharacterized protein YbjT (DUF2867 family)
MILVTGATGRVGGRVVARLAAAGEQVRALVRNPDAVLPAGVDAAPGDLTEPATVDTAAKGADTVFLVFPTLRADHVAAEVVAALTRHARHIVYLSAAGARQGDGILGSHARLEALIEQSGAEWTFLRPSGFATNTLLWADQVRAGDVVRWFHGAARRALIHEDDIAAAGVRALTEQGHAGTRPHLTGPEQLTQVQQVAAIGDALGRPLRFEQLTEAAARERFFGDVPSAMADDIMSGHARMIAHPEPMTTTVEDITGTPARTYAQWAADHAADFR